MLPPFNEKGNLPEGIHDCDKIMIENEAQLGQAIEQMESLCHAIDSLRVEVFPQNPRNFAILVEGPLDQIRQLQVQIDEYVQRLESAPA